MASVATLARPYQDYAFDYGSQGLPQQPADHVAVTAAEYGQLMAAQSFQQPQSNPYMHSPEPATQAYQQHGMAAVLPSHISATEAPYGVEQAHMMPVSRRVSHATPAYGSPHENMQSQLAYQQQHPQQPQHSSARKRSHAEFYEYPEMHHMHASSVSSSVHVPVDMTPNGHHGSISAPAYAYGSDISPTHSPSGHSVSHHHHRLPNQPPPSKFHRTGYGEEMYTAAEDHGPPSVVGQPGMPEPAAKPKGPKLKFTPEDDALLVELKETKNLTWKQIADFFPGRSSGTLQVRYCTKLKAKTMVWTDDMLDRLRQSLEEYEHDRWRIVSSKVGNGFSAAACKEKIDELNGVPIERRSPVAGDEPLDSMPASAIGDDDASQSFDKYENSLSVHSQSFDGSMSQAAAAIAAEHPQQQPYESALPPHQQSMADPRRLSDHHPYESALPPHHQQQMNNRISEVA
ncbi:hypothetical protein WHR41_00134 [Cladosporium halotolerans]|uniref:Myb-like domain-containing protein n=1 Tax=Cladosporium halotolerans TaxID=1052096 RepID=A0AB34L129_9PEZI